MKGYRAPKDWKSQMSMKKTLPVPTMTDGVPIVVDPLERTREMPAPELLLAKIVAKTPEIPREISDEELTIPVHSSIESTLNFEVLRQQSTEEDEPK
jgi:hypothetical protein